MHPRWIFVNSCERSPLNRLSVFGKFEIGSIRETLDPNAVLERVLSFISSIFAGHARRRLQNQTSVHKLRQRSWRKV